MALTQLGSRAAAGRDAAVAGRPAAATGGTRREEAAGGRGFCSVVVSVGGKACLQRGVGVRGWFAGSGRATVRGQGSLQLRLRRRCAAAQGGGGDGGGGGG